MSEEHPQEEPELARPAAIDFNAPGSVRTLKKAYNLKLRMPDAASFSSEIMGESDRATVILASSQLDDLLANAIALKMSEFREILVSDVEYIFRASGPLGSFSARAEVANLFGIIENETYEQLTILREMRNACAHSKHPITFHDPLLRNVAVHLFEPKGVTPLAFAEKDMKKAFVLEITFLAAVLVNGSRQSARVAREAAVRAVVEKEASLRND